jgi:hypothetical protein
MVWSHNDLWLLTADHGGFVKYWQSNMNNVKMYEAHKEPVRGLRWAWNSSITHSNWISFFIAIILFLYHKIIVVKIFKINSLVFLVYYKILIFRLIFMVFLMSIFEIEIKGIIDRYRLKGLFYCESFIE